MLAFQLFLYLCKMVYTFFDLDKVTDEMFDDWLKKLPKFRQDAVLRYRFREDRIRSLCAYLLLCVGLGRIVKNFAYNEHGKPLLTDDHLQINLSHGKSAVAAGFSETELGIDVEFIRNTYPHIVCKRVFTPAEIMQIETANDPTLAFFKFWTLKESYIKCIGQGFTFPLQTVEFQIVNDTIHCSDPRFTFSTFTQNGHQISICGTEQQVVRDLSLGDFLEAVKKIHNHTLCLKI